MQSFDYSIVTVDENLGPPHLSKLMNGLLTGLQGRTWEGKVFIWLCIL